MLSFPLKRLYKKGAVRCLGIVLAGITLLTSSLTAHAGIKEDNIATNQLVAVESNQIPGWPQGPTTSARSAILMELETGTILYAKNIHNKEYPASITKILTTLIASEECEMDEMVTFSTDAIFDIDRGSNHVALDVGESITVEQCLNAILIRSANEVSLGIAEHISGGSWEEFGPIMNERAKELGALNSNFVNPNGLPNEDHYTTAYDMAMIGRAFFSNEILCNITTTRKLHIPPSDTQPDDIIEYNQMELIDGGKYEYEYLVGCKTGYTNDARSTLVSCAEKDGMRLICVVLRDEAPCQYEDTLALFDYGFANFKKLNISENDTKYNMESGSSFYSENDVLGNSKPILSLNTSDYIVVPNTVEFTDTKSAISYETQSDTQAALITYTYRDWVVGTASIDFTGSLESGYEFEHYIEGESPYTAGGQSSTAGESDTGKAGVDESAGNEADRNDTGNEASGNKAGDEAENNASGSPEATSQTSDKTAETSTFAKIGKVLLTIFLVLIALAAIALAILFIRHYITIRRRRNRNRRRRQTLRPSNDPYAMVNRDNYRKSQIADAKRRQRAAETKRRTKRRNARWH